MDVENIFRKKIFKIELSDCLLIICIFIYSVVFSYYNIMKHYSFRSFAWDFGIITQSISTTIKGELFVNNVEIYYSKYRSYFGVHFSPVYFLILPIFYLFQKAETVLVLQVVILSLSAIPFYLLSKIQLKSRTVSLLLGISYLLNPSLQGMSWYHFPPQTFLPLFILSGVYFLKKDKKLLCYISLILSLMTSEQTLYFIFLHLLYIFWYLRDRIRKDFSSKKISSNSLYIISIFVTVVMWYLITSYVKNVLNPNPPTELKALGAFKYLMINDIFEIPYKFLESPSLFIKAIQVDLTDKLLYIFLTIAPGGFLSLLSPVALIPCFLWLLVALISNHRPYYELGFQYSGYTLPFVMIATLDGLEKLIYFFDTKRINDIIYKLSFLLLSASILLSIFTSPLSFLQKPGDFSYFRDYGITYPSFKDYSVIEVLNSLPYESLILTTPTMFPIISTYPNAYTIPPLNTPSQRLFSSHLSYLKSLKYDYIIFTYFWDKPISDLIYTNFIYKNKDYGLFLRGAGLEVYKRDYAGPPINISLKFCYKEISLKDSTIKEDHSSSSGRVIYVEPSVVPNRVAWFGPYITLTPGNYTVNFKIKIDNLDAGKVIKLEVWSNSLKKTLGQMYIFSSDFKQPMTWNVFQLSFEVNDRIGDVEFRGLDVGRDVSISLDYIEVVAW